MSNKERAVQLLDQIPESEMHYIIRILERVAKPDDTSKRMEGLRVLQSFAGTLPESFDYKHELEEIRNEKIDVLIGAGNTETPLEIIKSKFRTSWDDIEEIEPDEIDLQMLKAIEEDPECHIFTKESEINWDE